MLALCEGVTFLNVLSNVKLFDQHNSALCAPYLYVVTFVNLSIALTLT